MELFKRSVASAIFREIYRNIEKNDHWKPMLYVIGTIDFLIGNCSFSTDATEPS
jgi:hypothetical protein